MEPSQMQSQQRSARGPGHLRRRRLFSSTAVLMLLAVLLLGGIPSSPVRAAAAPPPAPALSDLAGHWAEEPVHRLVQKGLIRGLPDGTFHPEDALTRAGFFALLQRALATIDPIGTEAAGQAGLAGPIIRPQGVPVGHWARGSLDALLTQDIVRAADYPDGIDLDQPIPRREVARLVVRAMGLEAEARTRRGINQALVDIAADPEARTITTAVAHGYLTGYPDGRFRPEAGLTRAEGAVVILRLVEPEQRVALWHERYRYTVGDRELWLQVLRVNLRRRDLQPRVVTAAGGSGATQDPLAMAQAAGALAAINGTYLNAYTEEGPRDPYGTVIAGGKVLHSGANRAAIGFWPDGRARIGPITPRIEGGSDGRWYWPYNWYAYGFNHTGTEWGENWVVIHTPERGENLKYDAGTSVVVKDGVITRITAGNVPIPRDGFVVNLGGTEATEFLRRFEVGQPLEYRVALGPEWEGVTELLQAGPLMLREGRVAVDFAGEGFTEEKITAWAWNRSAVGITQDQILLLVTTGPVKVADLAGIMADLGARDAMAMDSGASSALVYRGEYLTPAGREISNILAIVPR